MIRMGQMNINKLGKQFKQVFSEKTLNCLRKKIGFCKRERDISPFRLALGLLETLANTKVESLADLQRSFNAVCRTNVHYKPFYNQLAKRQFPDFMRLLCERIMNEFTESCLVFVKESPFKQFSKILIHDGSSFGLKSGLKDNFPGRFTTIKPAAVELHVTMDLLSEGVESIILTPDTESEVHYAPAPQTVTGSLVLLDRMFFIKDYLAKIEQADGHYVVRSKGVINPLIIKATRPDGRDITSWQGKWLKSVRQNIRRYELVDLTVRWSSNFEARIIASWDHKNNRVRYLVTNLSESLFNPKQVMEAYRLRWQIELMFKEWKSYANLHSFDTNNPAIAEGLIWSSIASTLLKRLLALNTQKIKQISISTRTAAMSMRQVLAGVIEIFIHNPKKLNQALTTMVDYLATAAKRAHPERDKQIGRLVLGLYHAV